MRTTPTPENDPGEPRPANRAQRRAAARGRAVGGDARVTAPRATGPREHTKPAHARADFVARRSG
jgi:hypothetical protein